MSPKTAAQGLKMSEKTVDIQNRIFDLLNDKSVFRQAENYAFTYMDELLKRPVFPTQAAIEALCAFVDGAFGLWAAGTGKRWPLPCKRRLPISIIAKTVTTCF